MSNRIGPLKGYTLVSVDEDYHGSSVLRTIKRDIIGEVPSAPSVSFDANFVKRQEIIDRRVFAEEKGLSVVDFIRNDRALAAIAEPDNYVEVIRLNEETAGVALTKSRGDAVVAGIKSSFQYLID